MEVLDVEVLDVEGVDLEGAYKGLMYFEYKA